jgi:phage terminase large subunit GpA-like protein
LLHETCTRPGIKILIVSPRFDQAKVFSHSRLLPCLEESPLIRRALLGRTRRRPPVLNLRFHNGSSLFIRAAFRSADAARGISADLLLVDEYQDIAPGDLPVLQEALSHSKCGRTILTGTPKTIDNHLEAVFGQSTAHEWNITCPKCGRWVILDETSLGPSGPVCDECQVLLDPRQGRWEARNPGARWGDGFWVNHLMVPWLSYDEILERRQVYDFAKFKNEVLGMPTTLGEHVVTRAELEACCSQRAIAARADIPPHVLKNLVAGIDWGGGGTSRTVFVLGYLQSDKTFHVCRFERFPVTEEPDRVLDGVARLCAQFRVGRIAADGGGNGHVLNRMLLDRLKDRAQLVGILYSQADQDLKQYGAIFKWTVNRSGSISDIFSRVKKRSIVFPRVDECRSYLEEFAAEYAVYDDISRTIRYSHPQTQQDDALHAAVYAFRLGLLTYSDTRASSTSRVT